MNKNQSVSRIDKFLGLNETDTSGTELQIGEASRIENWRITDGANLETRHGFDRARIRNVTIDGIGSAVITGMWSGFLLDNQYLVLLFGGVSGNENKSAIVVYDTSESPNYTCVASMAIQGKTIGYPNKIFYFDSRLYAFIGSSTILSITLSDTDGSVSISAQENLYSPVVITGAAPTGGGTTLEPLNMLTASFRVKFSADGKSAAYVLPANTSSVSKVIVDNVEHPSATNIGTFNASSHTFTFTPSNIPGEGINNVEFFCNASAEETAKYSERFFKMPYYEAYNGSTDSRLFFYGDGTNKTFYTGVPSDGTGLYLPAMNEIAVDFSDAPITGMVRHYTKLMVFKPDGAATITYEPVTLADGSVIAGFYMRNASREIGNDAPGQVQTVNNYPRTLFKEDLYEWRVTSSYYQDERYAKRISERIQKTLASADPSKMVTCDDNLTNTYYIFLNDGTGRILVNNYRVDVWTVYISALAKNVKYAKMCAGKLLFATEKDVFYLSSLSTYDAPLEDGGEKIPIEAVWESGFMHFGADYLRKYSSDIWISSTPQTGSALTITAVTDRRGDYAVKEVKNNILDWAMIDFSRFTFNYSRVPRMKRVKLKVKKFVYYKLIFKVNEPGATASVLSVDQTVRYAGYAK